MSRPAAALVRWTRVLVVVTAIYTLLTGVLVYSQVRQKPASSGAVAVTEPSP